MDVISKKAEPNRPKTKLAVLPPNSMCNHDSIMAGLLILLIALVPFVVRLKVIGFTAPRILVPLLDTGLHGGFFAYYKWLLVLVVTVAVMAVLVHKMLVHKYTLQASYINVPLLILALLVLLSLLAAQYKSIALLGLYNQRDGALIWLAYLALFLAAANTVYKPWFSQGVNIALLIIIVINTAIVLWDFSGHRLVEYEFVKILAAPPELRNSLSGDFNSTMGNFNYVSGFAAALFAYFMSGTLLYTDWKKRLPALLAALAAFGMVLASLSSSGFVTLLFISPLLAAVIFRSADKKKSLQAGAAVLAACLLIFLLMNAYNPQVAQETTGLIQSPLQTSEQETAPPQERREAGKGEEFSLPQPGWSAGTGRVYIWRETINLTLERPFIGYGPGTLAYYFPQNDINKVANMNDYNTLITKPHNMYLGVAYGLGIPALLGLLILFLLHFYFTGRYLWRTELNQNHVFPAALFLFFCAFAVQAMVNDTVIDAGAIFWILMGAAVSLNLVEDQPPTS